MALIKYKVLESEIKDGVAYIPEKAIPLGIWALSESSPSVVTYKTNVAFMMKYEDWAEEFPDEVKAEDAPNAK